MYQRLESRDHVSPIVFILTWVNERSLFLQSEINTHFQPLLVVKARLNEENLNVLARALFHKRLKGPVVVITLVNLVT